jgi:hypothetical protein
MTSPDSGGYILAPEPDLSIDRHHGMMVNAICRFPVIA